MAANENPLNADTQHLQCSFCGVARRAVKWMVGDPDEFRICNVCVGLAETAAEHGDAFNNLVTLRRDPHRHAMQAKMAELSRAQEEMGRLLDEYKTLSEAEVDPCRFCGNQDTTIVRLPDSDLAICDECLEECHVVVKEGLEASD